MFFNCLPMKFVDKKWPNISRKYLINCYSSKPRKFEDIPGPKSLPIIGTMYKYLPYIGIKQFKYIFRIINLNQVDLF